MIRTIKNVREKICLIYTKIVQNNFNLITKNVDFATDDTVLTTIGNFLDYVPDQEWLKTILPQLIEKQTGNLPIEKVIIFNRYEEMR